MLLRLVLVLSLAAGGASAASKEEAMESLFQSYEAGRGGVDSLLKLRYAFNDALLQAALAGLDDSAFPALGAAGSERVFYEFSDYQCGYCRRMYPLLATASEDGGVKIALIEFPILGPLSEKAARYALAAHRQGGYEKFHDHLMRGSGPLSEEKLDDAVRAAQLDKAQLEIDSSSAAVDAQIEANYKLAALLGISGTPAFIIDGEIYPGALPEKHFMRLVQEQP